MPLVYLDNNATTPPADEVVEAMLGALRETWANPSSVHRPGQRARERLELARQSVCRLIGCAEGEMVFTSGGTEAASLAVTGILDSHPQRPVLLTSRLEHSAVRQLAETLERRGADVRWLDHEPSGLVRLDALEGVLRRDGPGIGLVSIMWVNNETGVIQPLEAVGRLCRAHGVRLHTDATQAVGRLPLAVAELPVDLLSFAAHKFHGPQGVGGLFVRRGVRLVPRQPGGPQERERRGGTENVPGIVGLGVAADLAAAWLAGEGPRHAAARRDRLEGGLVQAVPGALVNGADAPRLWTTSNVAFPGLEAEAILLMLSERGVCASAGAACSSGSLDPSPVLRAMGFDEARTLGSIRLSLSRRTTDEEIDVALEVIPEVVEKLKAES